MTKRLYGIALLVCACLMFAGSASAQFRYGVIAGADITKTSFKQDLFDIHARAGASAGVVGELMFSGIGIGVDLGLQWQMRSSQLCLGQRPIWADQGLGNVNFTQQYVTIPLHLRWKWTRLNGFEDKAAPFIYAGPLFAFNVAHTKIESFSFAEGDVGIDVGLGGELFKKWQISGGYSFGMTYSMQAKILTGFSNRWNMWQIRLAYLF